MHQNHFGLRRVVHFCALVSFFLSSLLFAQPKTVFAAPATPTAAGAWDDRFGYVGVEGRVTALAEAPNGDLYVGGDFTKAGGMAANRIARWDGRSWHALGDGLNDLPHSIVVDGTDVYVGGKFTTAGAVGTNGIARWDGNAWSTVGNGTGVVDDYFGTPEAGQINTMVLGTDKLYIGGEFVSIDGVPANNVAQWDGNTWSALGQGIGRLDWESKFSAEGEVNALALDGATLYAGGDFVIAGDVTANAVARWDGNTWSALDGGVTRIDGNGSPESGIVKALAVADGTLYTGGWFTKAGAIAANHVAAWHGTAWSALGVGVKPEQFFSEPPVFALTVSDDGLYVGGRFINAGNQAIALLARWDGTNWSAVGEGVSNDGYHYVTSLTVAAAGGVYSGGAYRVIGNQRTDNIAHWSGTAWRALGGGLMRNEYGDSPATPYAIVVDGAGRVYAGGEFALAGGVRTNNLAHVGKWPLAQHRRCQCAGAVAGCGG